MFYRRNYRVSRRWYDKRTIRELCKRIKDGTWLNGMFDIQIGVHKYAEMISQQLPPPNNPRTPL